MKHLKIYESKVFDAPDLTDIKQIFHDLTDEGCSVRFLGPKWMWIEKKRGGSIGRPYDNKVSDVRYIKVIKVLVDKAGCEMPIFIKTTKNCLDRLKAQCDDVVEFDYSPISYSLKVVLEEDTKGEVIKRIDDFTNPPPNRNSVGFRMINIP